MVTIKQLILLIASVISFSGFILAGVIDDAMNAVGLIITYDDTGKEISQGTGFFISSDGMLVTNMHVYEGAKSSVIKMDTGAFYKIESIVGANNALDIIILKVAGKNLPLIKMGDSSMSKIGDEITVLSNPKGYQNTLSMGNISGLRSISNPDKTKNEDIRFLQITAPISEGSSGGPVLNTVGEAIGIASFVIDGQNLNFAIPIEYAKKIVASSTMSKFDASVFKKLESRSTFLFISGLLTEDSGDIDKAIECYKEAIKQDKMFKDAYYSLEFIYYQKGMYKEEVQLDELLVQYFPDDYYAFHSLGIAYEAIGEEDKAIDSYLKALKIKSDFQDSIWNVGLLYVLKSDCNGVHPVHCTINPIFLGLPVRVPVSDFCFVT